MARETLGLWDVTIMGQGIVTAWLGNGRQVGNDLLSWGKQGHVVGKIVRWGSHVLLQRTRREKGGIDSSSIRGAEGVLNMVLPMT